MQCWCCFGETAQAGDCGECLQVPQVEIHKPRLPLRYLPGKSTEEPFLNFMLAILGTLTVVVLLALILTKRLTPLSALITVPVIASLIAGFGSKIPLFMLHGVESVAGVAGMFIFAILYFGIVSDAGMLQPIIDRLLKAVGSDPARMAMGTALLALLVHLDGSGAVTFSGYHSGDAPAV